MHSINFPLAIKQIPTSKALRVRAVGKRDGWFYVISDGQRKTIKSNFGELPEYYADLSWNDQTATAYALLMASRYIASHHPGARVVMTCTTQPHPQRSGRGREQRRWAA